LIIPIKKETIHNISQLRRITNKNENEILSTALNKFLKKAPLISSTIITFFGLAVHASKAFNF